MHAEQVIGLFQMEHLSRVPGEGNRYTLDMPVPNDIAVYFDEHEKPVTCRSLEEVDTLLDRLHREADPTECSLAVAIKVFGHEIDMGLGTDQTFLCLQIEPCDGEYFLAVGEQTEG
jgi:hypothetical protein